MTLGFVPVCTLIGSAAEQRALHPPLRQFLEDRARRICDRDARSRAARHARSRSRAGCSRTPTRPTPGRRFACGSSACRPARASNRRTAACRSPSSGRWRRSALDEWRAGRTIRALALLRRPAQVPQRRRARSGTHAGPARHRRWSAPSRAPRSCRWSRADRGSTRRRPRFASAVRRAIDRHVGSRDPQSAAIAIAILIGDRGALDPWSSSACRRPARITSSRSPAATSRSSPAWCWASCGRFASAAAGRPAPPSCCWRRMPTSPAAARR